jgi:hypothetical protein
LPTDTPIPQRQFGLRGLLLAVGLIAVLLGMWRHSPLGIAAAITLGSGVAFVFWEARRSINLPEMAVIVGASLALELALGWAAGFFGYPWRDLYYVGSIARAGVLLWACIELLGEIVILLRSRPRSWREEEICIGPVGRLLLFSLSVPLFYSLPMRDFGVLCFAVQVGAEEIARDCIYHSKDSTDWKPATGDRFRRTNLY